MGSVSSSTKPPHTQHFNMKAFIIIALLGAASAFPMADHHNGKHHKPENHEDVRHLPEGPLRLERRANPPPPPYKPAPYAPPPPKYAPAPYAKAPEKKFPPAETQDGEGTVLGSYTVNLPDGRTQIVTYKADHYGGFVADVKYEGEAVYPPEPAEGYGNNKYVAPARKGYAPPA